MDSEKNNLPPAECEIIKQDYEGEMELKLKELGRKIDILIDKADASTDHSIKTLRLKKAEAETSLNTLKAASKEAWSEFKTGMDRAWEELQAAWSELKDGSEKAASKFKKTDPAL
jgi:hypothetical protein